ncbi:hypothetical protein BDN67DRAFT_107343 [Paxillus ammoniavirescens]|nr:hypothetical protein BDN67DRAFT_107343 [Paxillus ammoniavirescens]
MLTGSVQMLHDAHPPQAVFPVEVICQILGFLSPREIVRLRTVSKQFRDITYDPAIWKSVYANARLPRPPGPFPSQSTQFLEHTLLQSDRLAQTWTSCPVQVISWTLGPKLPSQLKWNVLDGRWLVWRETTQFLCHDLDTGSRQILYGRRVYIALNGTQPDQGGLPIHKMLEFEVDDSCSLSAPVSMDIPFFPGDLPRPRPLAISAQWPFVCIFDLAWESRTVVWDMRTRTFYALPPFNSALEKGPVTALPELILSKTHIIALYHCHDSPVFTSIFQAFVVPDLPPSSDNGIRELCLTHEASIHHVLRGAHLMRNSVFDPVTGATSLRLLAWHFTPGHYAQYTCIDLTLPGPELPPGDPLPMSVDMQDLFTTDMVCNCLTMSSDDGHLRGFACGLRAPHVWKFSVDASKERCVAVLGERCSLASIGFFNSALRRCQLDAVRGRLCFIKSGDRDRCDNVVAVDLK